MPSKSLYVDGATYTNVLFEALLFASWTAVALFAAGTVFVVLVLFRFVEEERYRRPPRPEKDVEFVAARRAVEAQISALSPKVMLLAEKECFLANHLKKGTSSEEMRRAVEVLLQDIARGGFWERFVEASVLAETDPVRAHKELGRLSAMAETALEKLGRAEELARRGEDAGHE